VIPIKKVIAEQKTSRH